MLALYLILISVYCLYLILNKLIKGTVWWNNQFTYTKQFVSNDGYRKDLHRNYEVVNVGSNPARFAFFYEDVLGENWSTGTQGLDMDLEILKYYHSYLKDGAYVLLPIVPFSSVSGYLVKSPISYYAKFVRILDSLQIRNNTHMQQARKYIKMPLRYNWRNVRHLIKDSKPDNRLNIVEQPLQLMEMEQSAIKIMNSWKDEFDIKEWRGELPAHLLKGREKSIQMMSSMISFLLERGYKPVLISPPMSHPLTKLFTPQIKENYIYSFVDEIKKLYDIPYLDYTEVEEFQEEVLYFNALFMNLKGRKLFTKRVLLDLGISSAS